MKKYLIILCLCLNLMFVNQNQAAATAYFTHAVFENSGQGTYLETYLFLIYPSLKSIKIQNGNCQSFETGMRFIQNNRIKNAKKYTLNSPELVDTSTSNNFDDEKADDNFGGGVNDNYINPK